MVLLQAKAKRWNLLSQQKEVGDQGEEGAAHDGIVVAEGDS
jgi:hypothetical protein